MAIELTSEEARVLGCLLEKMMATPEYYPLSLKALVNACNQKVNRTPVVSYDDATVLQAAESLRGKGLLWANTSGRVDKYKEGLMDALDLPKAEAAVICVLLLRGPQTVGEIRSRTERLYCFGGLDAVQGTLETLSEKGFVVQAPRLPGQKEQRFYHVFSEAPLDLGQPCEMEAPLPEPQPDRVAQLEQRVDVLSQELSELRELFEEFKRQFD